MSVCVCSMSTVSHGNPARAMNRAATMLPSDSQVPICGFPARNARLTGFSFKSVPRLRPFDDDNPRRNSRRKRVSHVRARGARVRHCHVGPVCLSEGNGYSLRQPGSKTRARSAKNP